MATDIKELTSREATRLVDRLRHVALTQPLVMRDVLTDLPDADINVLRGVLKIAKERAKHAKRSAAVV